MGIVHASDGYIKTKIGCHTAISFFENSCTLQCTLPLKQLFSVLKIKEKQEQRSSMFCSEVTRSVWGN